MNNHLIIKELTLNNMDNILENIRTIRESKGYSQESISEMLNMTKLLMRDLKEEQQKLTYL